MMKVFKICVTCAGVGVAGAGYKQRKTDRAIQKESINWFKASVSSQPVSAKAPKVTVTELFQGSTKKIRDQFLAKEGVQSWDQFLANMPAAFSHGGKGGASGATNMFAGQFMFKTVYWNKLKQEVGEMERHLQPEGGDDDAGSVTLNLLNPETGTHDIFKLEGNGVEP